LPGPISIPPAAPNEPLPVPSEPLGFGEVEFGEAAEAAPPPAAPLPVPPPADDPFASLELAPPPSPAPAPSPRAAPGPAASGAEELEPLFGEPSRRPPPGPAAGGFKVRRRSGKVFGPFEAAQIVSMVTKGELLGNEDVSSDGGGIWEPIGSVPAFADAMRTLTASPEELGGGAQPKRTAAMAGVPFGGRMAVSRMTEAEPEAEPGRRWLKPAIAAGAVLLLLGIGSSGLLTRHGLFYYKVFRGSGDRERIAQQATQARELLARDELLSDQSALKLAEQGLATDDREIAMASLQTVAVASLDRRHAASAASLLRARALASSLASQDSEDPVSVLAALAVATLDGGPALVAAEQALEKVKGGPTPDGLDLMGEAALFRGDAARATAVDLRLEAAQPNTVRAARSLGRAAAAGGDLAGAKAWFEKALARSPNHLPTRLELAALAVAAGEPDAASPWLDALLSKEAEPKLGPGERARALGIHAAVLERRAASSPAAEEAYRAALALDPRQTTLRLGLARLLLKRGEPEKSVAALDPLAGGAAGDPALAELRARALAASGRVLDAAQLVDAALGRSPGNPRLMGAKGAVLEAQAKPAEALKLYEAAAVKAPDDVALRVAIGRLALGERNLPAAEAALAVAVEKGPRDPAAHSALGDLRAARGDVAGAQAAYRAALLLDPEYAGAELGLAQLAQGRGDEAAARIGLEKVLALEPRNAGAHAALGSLRWKAGDLEGAEKSFATAVQLAPKNAQAQIRLGAVKLLRNDLTGAIDALTVGTGLDPNLPEGQHWLGRALLAKGEGPTALARLRRAVEQDPKNALFQLHLGIALERTNAPVEAVEIYGLAAAADPKFTEPVERLGLLYAGNGNCVTAMPFFEKAMVIDPRTSRFKVELADCRLRERRGADAIKLYREVLKSDPAEVTVPYKLARALHETKGAAAAQPWYEKAAAAEKANPMPHYYLGYAYKEKGLRARAVTEFKAYLSLKPDADDRDDIRREIEDMGGTP
jgi:predicted Zn-dependent protease